MNVLKYWNGARNASKTGKCLRNMSLGMNAPEHPVIIAIYSVKLTINGSIIGKILNVAIIIFVGI
jgi:hypothetical protein